MGLRAEILTEAAALEPHRPGWDALAAAHGRPYCAPAWMFNWLSTVAPADVLPRICVVRDGAELVGIAPFWTLEAGEDGRYGLLGERTAYPVEPLSSRGREPEVAVAVAAVLAAGSPQPRRIELVGVSAGSAWPRLLAEHWPGMGSPSIERTRVEPVPVVDLGHATLDEWLGARSRNLRQQLRQGRRRLESAGAQFRVSTPSRFDADLDALARLHHARWAPKGGSTALDSKVERLVGLAARDLGPERFRLLTIDVDGVPISAHLFIRAGGTRAYWLGGFDERWSACRPSMQVLVAAVADGIEQGDRRLELGPGGQDYKYRLADSECEQAVEWVTLAPSGR